MTFLLFDNASSLPCQRVRLTLAEKGEVPQVRPMRLDGDQFEPAFLKISPNGLAPAIQHEGHSFVEATVISHYVDEVLPTTSLMPSTPLLRARLRAITKIVDEILDPATLIISLGLGGQAFATPCPEQAAAACASGRERLAAEREMVANGARSEELGTAFRGVRAFFDRLERHLARGPFLAGDSATLADLAAFPYALRYRYFVGDALLSGRPQLALWIERLCERPSFRQMIGDHAAGLPEFTRGASERLAPVLA